MAFLTMGGRPVARHTAFHTTSPQFTKHSRRFVSQRQVAGHLAIGKRNGPFVHPAHVKVEAFQAWPVSVDLTGDCYLHTQHGSLGLRTTLGRYFGPFLRSFSFFTQKVLPCPAGRSFAKATKRGAGRQRCRPSWSATRSFKVDELVV